MTQTTLAPTVQKTLLEFTKAVEFRLVLVGRLVVPRRQTTITDVLVLLRAHDAEVPTILHPFRAPPIPKVRLLRATARRTPTLPVDGQVARVLVQPLRPLLPVAPEVVGFARPVAGNAGHGEADVHTSVPLTQETQA